MAGSAWVIPCSCGWSRFVPRSTTRARRRQLLAQHVAEAHPDKENPHE